MGARPDSVRCSGHHHAHPARHRHGGGHDTLEGYVDIATRGRIGGWAWDPQTPDQPVALQIVDNGTLIAVTVANGHRPDVAATGRGLRCGFDVLLPEGLSPLSRHVIEVRREHDGALLGAPVVIEAMTALDPATETAISRVIEAASETEDQDHVLSFLMGQLDRLTRQRADRLGGDTAVALSRARRRRGLPVTETARRPRALVIDGLRPDARRDAGSCALLSHMRALIGLGYDVFFIAADDIGRKDTPDAAPGVTVLAAPFYTGVEDVLRKHEDAFAVVYLHREEMATRYQALTRRFQRNARVVYSMADLHFLRMARQAVAQQRPELAARARLMKQAEYTAVANADSVLVHSNVEADLLRRDMPRANVHVVPWDITATPAARSFSDRSGVVFLGNYTHAPNVDAARWLIEEIALRVRQRDSSIHFRIAGAAMPESIKALAGEGIEIIGHAPDLDILFASARLSIAPLRFGAGVKGKVLESHARGVPCIMTPIAAEGLDLDGPLTALVARTADELAGKIVEIHNDVSVYQELSESTACTNLTAQDITVVESALSHALALFPETGSEKARLIS